MEASQRTLIFALGVALLLDASAATATPFTFQFDLPPWDFSAPASVFGTNGVLDITVDNGSSSDIGQTYLNSQITQVRLSAVGGTFSDTWSAADLSPTFHNALSASYLSTNAGATPTLDLIPSSVGSAMDWENPAAFFQLGVITPSGGPTTVDVNNSSGVAYYVPFIVSNGTDIFQGLEETGTVIKSVPEPATLALFGLGFLGLALGRRRLVRCASAA